MKTFKSDEEMMRIFDEGVESMTDYMVPGTLRKPGKYMTYVEGTNRLVPRYLLEFIDADAKRMGMTRAEFINWKIAEEEREEAEAARKRERERKLASTAAQS